MNRAYLLFSVGAVVPATSLVWWLAAPRVSPLLAGLIVSVALALILALLSLRLYLSHRFWLKLWTIGAPPLVSSLLVIPGVPLLLLLATSLLAWGLLGMWGAVRFYPFHLQDTRLHRARFARFHEVIALCAATPVARGLLLGMKYRRFVTVRPHHDRLQLGNVLICGPTRCGKGLFATAHLLSWNASVVVNDIKGDLYSNTAGYRSTLGPVFVIDPTGVGHCYDPLAGKHTEDAFYSAAAHLLYQPDEGEGRIFTQRATSMLTQLFVAARREGLAPFPYARSLIRMGVAGAAERLNTVAPTLATHFLDVAFQKADLSDRFLLSAWGTLTARMRPLLTETVVRSLATSTFRAVQLMKSPRPVTVYLRWKEQDLLALSPLVRLLWGSLIDELIATYDEARGQGCHPVLLVVDEAGRTAIPMLADQATTVVGRGISLWIALQSLSQLETVYGRSRAQVLRDNMESQLYYRPTDLATAKYLEERLGTHSAYAHSQTLKEGIEASEGRAERPVPLLTAQDLLQLHDEEVIGFHRRLPPLRLTRVDWRRHALLVARRNIPPPPLPQLPPLADIPEWDAPEQPSTFPHGYIDPDLRDDTAAPRGTPTARRQHDRGSAGMHRRGEIFRALR